VNGGVLMRRTRQLLAIVLALGIAVLATVPAAAQTVVGVTATEIKIGNTNPYSGPASAYGTIGKTITAYFKKVNDEGGINGRKINFITYDDAYTPPKTVEMVRKLVEQDQVAALFQTLGTPTNTAIHKYVNQQKVPHLFVATGATKWDDPKNFPWTMGFQPNYQTEGRVYAAYILKNIPDAKIGILYQNDDYGKDYVKGMEDGLGAAASKLIVLKQSHEVTDPTIDSQIINLKNSGANVFFNVTIPKFAVQAIRKAHDIGWKPTHFLNNVSSSYASVLKPAGVEASRGLITALYTKVVTDPQWKNDKGFQDWIAFMKKYYPEGSLEDDSNFFGYSAAILMTQVIKQCGNDLSRENIMRQAENLKSVDLPFLLPGIKVDTSPTDHAPIQQERLAKFNGEYWELFGETCDAFHKN
jgi:branched-chain amino acid transport system substrate-binding protein